jgi:hypothetical protein
MPRGPRGEKRPYKRVKLFASGKLGWLVLWIALRRGAQPMTARWSLMA